MSDSKDVKAETYQVLKLAQQKLNSAVFLYELRTASPELRDKALHAITDTALAVERFRQARLSAIAAEMKEGNKGIEEATKGLKDALADMQKIKPIIDGATALLKIVARIVSLV